MLHNSCCFLTKCNIILIRIMRWEVTFQHQCCFSVWKWLFLTGAFYWYVVFVFLKNHQRSHVRECSSQPDLLHDAADNIAGRSKIRCKMLQKKMNFFWREVKNMLPTGLSIGLCLWWNGKFWLFVILKSNWQVTR